VFVPDRGDLVWLNFDPRTGHEQSGRRPSLILSPKSYNRKAGLALVCPITSHPRGYPFEVPLPPGCGLAGVILADHIRSADWRARRATRISVAAAETVEDVLARLAPLLGY
jgi:mRNA interferase MazF